MEESYPDYYFEVEYIPPEKNKWSKYDALRVRVYKAIWTPLEKEPKKGEFVNQLIVVGVDTVEEATRLALIGKLPKLHSPIPYPREMYPK